MDSSELLLATTNQLTNTMRDLRDYQAGQEALAEQSRQFDENMKWLKEQYVSNLEFANKQHSEQMDFANRNLQSNEKIANRNLQLQQNAFDYQKELNATQMEREDSAIQRQIADYQAAGFSKLAAIGGNGASSNPLTSAAAPQMDVSGINSASGIYADFAKQYAALSLTARNDYMKGRSEFAHKHNAEITASKIALQQMRADMRYKAQSASTELFNAAVNYRDSKLNRDYVEEQTKYLKNKGAWEEIHGYRGESPVQALTGAVLEYINSKRKDGETTLEAAYGIGKDGVEFVHDTIQKGQSKLNETVVNKINDADLTKNQKVAVMFYLTAIKQSVLATKLGKNLKGLYYTGEAVYHLITGRKKNEED